MAERLLVLLVFAIFTHPAGAVDFSGVTLRELPIPVNRAEQAERARLLKPVRVDAAWFATLTPAQKTKLLKAAAHLEKAQAKFVERESATQRAEDARANPEALCKKAFGPQFEFGGSIQTDNADGTYQRSYLCSADGPSQRTDFERRLAEINGMIEHVEFKLRHPLSSWAG